MATQIFRYRFLILTAFAVTALFLGYHASGMKVATDFNKMIPLKHEYIKNYNPFKKIFGCGNKVKLEVSYKNGTIISPDRLKTIRSMTEDVMFVKGVDRSTVRSIVSPETRYMVVTEIGFEMGPVVPNVIPETDDGLLKIKNNIMMSGNCGLLVSMDLKSALINGEIYESGVDYLSVYRQLNEIRDRYTSDDISVHINGFAMVTGFVNDAMPKILGLFGLSVLITIVILYRLFHNLRLAVLPVISGGMSVLCSIGILKLIGMQLDPMTTIVPFLVFAIGVSHAIQMIKRYLEACRTHPSGYEAALHALAVLMLPGIVALTTDAMGFLTIMFVPIGVIQDLAIAASVGVACIVVNNSILLSLILSFFPIIESGTCSTEGEAPSYIQSLFSWMANMSVGKNTYKVVFVSLVLLVAGLFSSRTMKVGDINPGEPLLWEDSIYNLDASKLMTDFMLGIDTLSIVVTGEEAGICKNYDVLKVISDFEWEIGEIPGVTVIVSPLVLARVANEMLHESDIKWRTLPQTTMELATIMNFVGSNDDSEFMDMGCRSINIRIFLSDHKGDTIRHVVQKIKQFINDHPVQGAKFVLAGGNAGVMAATNEEVAGAQVPMLLLIYGSIFILCLINYRSIAAPFIIMFPLVLVSVLATMFMRFSGLGLNVNTLPVASLGVGIGVDYGIYIYSRLTAEMKRSSSYIEAVESTLNTTGAAVLYTALTLSAGVLTWLSSDLKFQADMGLLLGFIFLANMVCALVLIPSLAYLLKADKMTTT